MDDDKIHLSYTELDRRVPSLEFNPR